jgi:hypothetical protein
MMTISYRNALGTITKIEGATLRDVARSFAATVRGTAATLATVRDESGAIVATVCSDGTIQEAIERAGEETYSLYESESGDRLSGEIDRDLIDASLDKHTPGGVVHAIQDESGTWQYVPSDRVEDYRRRLAGGHDVHTVYVLAD